MFSRHFSRHKEEARVAGVTDVIDLELPDEDELDRDLILLAQQQEKLLAELALAYEQESEREREELESGRREAFDKEMEARVKAMNLSVAPEEIEGAFEEVREVSEIKPPLCAIVLLSSFHFSGHTVGFHPQTQKFEPPCTA